MTITSRWGIVLGRFQPFHLGHLEYVEAARSRSGRVVIGITNPDPTARIESAADPNRTRPENNPFTFFERLCAIDGALQSEGWTASDYVIVAAPLGQADRLTHYLPPPLSARAYLTVYDKWGDEKTAFMQSLGYETEVMWRRSPVSKVTSGTEVRRLMRAGEPWEHLVPVGAVAVLRESIDEWNGSAHAATY